MSSKNIVIVGGGYAGIECAQALDKTLPPSTANITVVEKQEFTFHCVGAARALVDPAYVPKLFIPIDKACSPRVHIVHAIADTVNVGENQLSVRKVVNGSADDAVTSLPFDYLIVATGSSYPSPMRVDENAFSRNAIEDAIRNTYEKIKSAKRVLVVGGGPVGCEVAGEIAVAYPDKKVTLLEGNDKLVAHSKMTDKFRWKLMERLVQINVNVLLGERLPERPTGNLFEASTVTTSKGTVVESDIQLLCAGAMPNVELIRSLDANLIDKDKGSIKVKSNLQLDDDRYAHIYVIGDANNHPTPKLAYTGGEQAKFIGNQLACHIKSNGSRAIEPFVPGVTEGMFVPLGPHGGVSQLPLFGGVVVGDTITKMVKSKDYAAGYMWGKWKAKLPST